MRETVATSASLAEPWFRDANVCMEVYSYITHVRAASATPTTIRGRLLFFRALFNCGYYSRAVTIRGVATIRVNTVYTYASLALSSCSLFSCFSCSSLVSCSSCSSVTEVKLKRFAACIPAENTVGTICLLDIQGWLTLR